MYLNCHSYFSFRYGTLSVKRLLELAQTMGIQELALTDINNTSGCLEFIRQAPNYGVRPIVGIDFRNGVKQQFVAIAKSNAGFEEINRYLSTLLASGENVPQRAPVFAHAFVIYPLSALPRAELRENEFVGIPPYHLHSSVFRNQKIALKKLVAIQPVSFEHKKSFNAHRLLRAIDNNVLLSKLSTNQQGNPLAVMLPWEKVAEHYHLYPQLLNNAAKLTAQCGIQLEFGSQKNKKTYTQSAKEDGQLLRSLAYEGLQYRYPNPSKEVMERLEKELEVIRELDFNAYFLINWDIVHYARGKDYFYVGRGSGANSMVAYCLRITDVDPIDLDLYFERFINPARQNPPDFDIDFSWKDRDDIIRHIFQKYGQEHTALLATYSTFKQKAVVRELGKVFGLPKAEIDQLIGSDGILRPSDHLGELVCRYGAYIHDFPSHLSIHAGGILIAEAPIYQYTATSFPPKGLPLAQFSMLEAEDVGLYKFDILSQRGLGHIRDAICIVRENYGQEIDIHRITDFKQDEKIKTLLRSGKTMGCFYVESPAMRMLLKKLEADTYLGLVAASSIIRPGVAKSGMMREYILRFRHPERVADVNQVLLDIMPETFGVMVYQEDVIKVAHYFAGLTLTEADVLRRGMSGKYRSRDEFKKVQAKFFSNCAAMGYEKEFVKDIWRQIESFAGYAFSKGHSASYAVESYQSLFLKAHFPLEFMVAVINNFGGFYATEYYIHEAKMAGASVLPPCVNHSEALSRIVGKNIYLGLGHVRDLNQDTMQKVMDVRSSEGPYSSLADFVERVPIAMEQLVLLIRIGAFRFSKKSKRALLWEAHHLLTTTSKSEARADLFRLEPQTISLPDLPGAPFEDAFDQLELMGFSLTSPFSLIPKKKEENTITAKTLVQHLHRDVEMIGYLVTIKNTSTSKGDAMQFGTFLDRQGLFFDTTHFPNCVRNYPFRGKGCYRLFGKVVEEFGFYSLTVSSMEKIPWKADERYF